MEGPQKHYERMGMPALYLGQGVIKLMENCRMKIQTYNLVSTCSVASTSIPTKNWPQKEHCQG